jgi:hypothetical protein
MSVETRGRVDNPPHGLRLIATNGADSPLAEDKLERPLQVSLSKIANSHSPEMKFS